MGTRGLMGFVADGELKVQYNQFDSYPEGWLSLRVLPWLHEILSTPEGENKAKNLVRVLEQVPDEDPFYWNLRDNQGDPEATLASGQICGNPDFAQDSLFCEWVHIINFDTRQVETYGGFQTTPHDEGRFAGDNFYEAYSGKRYYPVRPVFTHSFDTLPIAIESHYDENTNVETYEPVLTA